MEKKLTSKFKVYICINILLFIACFSILTPVYASQDQIENDKIVKIGVLAKYGYAATTQKWTLTAEYLTKKIPGYSFEIKPLGFDEILTAVENNKIDFIFANPAYYVMVERDYGCERIATLCKLISDNVYTVFSGVVFTRADNADIHNYDDLKGKKFMGVHKYSFGGWLMALREFKNAGLNPYDDFKEIRFGNTHQAVVMDVLAGKVDAGTVRSGILEKLASEKKINLNDLRVINKQTNVCSFKVLHSTSDYPEWPIARLKNTDCDLAKKVMVTLIEMSPNESACQTANCAGWTIPHNYQAVHQCLKELGVSPYIDYGKVKFLDILEQHWLWLLGISITFSIFFLYLNIRLKLVIKAVKKGIHQRFIVESELQDSEQRNLALLKAIPDLIFVYDSEGVFLDFNAKSDKDLLLPPEQFIGKNIKDVMPEKIAQGTFESIRKTLQTGEIQSFDYSLEKKQKKMYYESKHAAFGKNKVIAVVRDITKRVQSEIVLRENEEKERKFSKRLTALNEVTANLSKCDNEDELWRQAVIMGKNRLGFGRLGIWLRTKKQNEMRGTFGIDLNGNLLDERHLKYSYNKSSETPINQFIENNKSSYYKENDIIMDNEIKKIVGYADRAVYPLWAETKMIGLIATDNFIEKKPITENDRELLALYARLLGHLCTRNRDEEKKLQLERQMQHAQKLESLGVLAGGIAHDFNNILMGVIGYADLTLQELPPASPARNSIKEINKSACRAAELAKQMLAYSGKGKFLIGDINLNKLIDEISHILEVSISKKAILKYNFADNLPLFKGDITQIRQVIMNLITNASEALDDMNGVISLSTGTVEYNNKDISGFNGNILPVEIENKTLNGTYIYIEVSDTGCGMDNEIKSKIFDPFFTTKFTGRGLGMAAVRGIMRGHNGIIELNSKQGKGTTFRIMFPANTEKTQLIKTQDNDKMLENEWHGSGTILIADDEETICVVNKYMLEQIGFDVLTAYDGAEAVNTFREHADEIVCVLLDLTMPRLSGEEVFQEIKTIKSDVKVILSSGYDKQDAMQRFSCEGIAGFIQKPYAFALLKEKLRKIL